MGPLVAGRLRGAAQKVALRLRLPNIDGTFDVGDAALVRAAIPAQYDANGNIVFAAVPSGMQALCAKLKEIYGLRDQDQTMVSVDAFFEFKRSKQSLSEYASEFELRYEEASDRSGLSLNKIALSYLFLRNSGIPDRIQDDLRMQVQGDLSRYEDIRSLVLRMAKMHEKEAQAHHASSSGHDSAPVS